MEELPVDPNLYALEEMMINQQWSEVVADDDFDDDDVFLLPEIEYHSFGSVILNDRAC